MDAETISKALGGRKAGTGWYAQYPAHADTSPSQSVSELPDGRILPHCFAGCDVHAVTAATDVALSDLFPMRHMLKGDKLLSASTQVVQINRIDDLYFHYFIQIHASDSSARRGGER